MLAFKGRCGKGYAEDIWRWQLKVGCYLLNPIGDVAGAFPGRFQNLKQTRITFKFDFTPQLSTSHFHQLFAKIHHG